MRTKSKKPGRRRGPVAYNPVDVYLRRVQRVSQRLHLQEPEGCDGLHQLPLGRTATSSIERCTRVPGGLAVDGVQGHIQRAAGLDVGALGIMSNGSRRSPASRRENNCLTTPAEKSELEAKGWPHFVPH